MKTTQTAKIIEHCSITYIYRYDSFSVASCSSSSRSVHQINWDNHMSLWYEKWFVHFKRKFWAKFSTENLFAEGKGIWQTSDRIILILSCFHSSFVSSRVLMSQMIFAMKAQNKFEISASRDESKICLAFKCQYGPHLETLHKVKIMACLLSESE